MYSGCIVDGPYILLNEISQTEKDKYCMFLFICGVKKKKKTHRYRKQILAARGGVWVVGKMDEGSQEVKVSIHNKN